MTTILLRGIRKTYGTTEAIKGGNLLIDGQRVNDTGPADRGLAAGVAVTLGIRPEGQRLDAGGALRGIARLVERLGGLTPLHVDTVRKGDLVTQVEGSNPAAAHQAVQLSVGPAACHLFNEAGLAMPHLQQHSLAA